MSDVRDNIIAHDIGHACRGGKIKGGSPIALAQMPEHFLVVSSKLLRLAVLVPAAAARLEHGGRCKTRTEVTTGEGGGGLQVLNFFKECGVERVQLCEGKRHKSLTVRHERSCN